jgi:hypothetical protein
MQTLWRRKLVVLAYAPTKQEEGRKSLSQVTLLIVSIYLFTQNFCSD